MAKSAKKPEQDSAPQDAGADTQGGGRSADPPPLYWAVPADLGTAQAMLAAGVAPGDVVRVKQAPPNADGTPGEGQTDALVYGMPPDQIRDGGDDADRVWRVNYVAYPDQQENDYAVYLGTVSAAEATHLLHNMGEPGNTGNGGRSAEAPAPEDDRPRDRLIVQVHMPAITAPCAGEATHLRVRCVSRQGARILEESATELECAAESRTCDPVRIGVTVHPDASEVALFASLLHRNPDGSENFAASPELGATIVRDGLRPKHRPKLQAVMHSRRILPEPAHFVVADLTDSVGASLLRVPDPEPAAPASNGDPDAVYRVGQRVRTNPGGPGTVVGLEPSPDRRDPETGDPLAMLVVQPDSGAVVRCHVEDATVLAD